MSIVSSAPTSPSIPHSSSAGNMDLSMFLQQSPYPSAASQLFQRSQQFQPQQAIPPNPAYQLSAPQAIAPNLAHQPSAPSAPIHSYPVSTPYLSHGPLFSNPSAPYTPGSLFGGFGNSLSATWSTCLIKQSNAQPDYYPPPTSVDPERTLRKFELFLKLPMEILGLVVEQCALQDGVCLSLASKDLYTIVRPILLRCDKEAFSLSRMSKYVCKHFASKTLDHKPCTRRNCSAAHRTCGGHCVVCVSCPLWVRLSNNNWGALPSKKYAYCSDDAVRWAWIPAGEDQPKTDTILSGNSQGMKAPICGKFKLRAKFHNGRCLHGGQKPKKRKEGQLGLTWTHNKGSGGWHVRGKLWKAFYTETNLRTFQDRYKSERKNSGGYSLRAKPKPTAKRVEHVNLQRGVDLENPSGRGPVEGTKGWEQEVPQQREYNYRA